MDKIFDCMTIFNSAPFAMVLLDSEGYFLRANECFKQMAGLTQVEVDSLVGEGLFKSCYDYSKTSGCRFNDSCYSCRLGWIIEETIANREGLEKEEFLLKLGGHDVVKLAHVEASTTYIPKNGGMVLLTLRDISSQKALIRDLKKRDSLINRFLMTAQAFVLVLDKDLKVQMVNPFATKISGYSEDELLAMDVVSMVQDEEQRERIYNNFSTVFSKREVFFSYHTLLKTKSGNLRDIQWNTNYIESDDSDPLILLMGYDITSEMKKEHERELLAERIKESQKLEAIGTLASGIAHDFNNILGAVMGFAELTLREVHDPVVKDYQQTILKAGERAAALVKQILTFSRESVPDMKPLYLDSLIDEVIFFMSSVLPSNVVIEKNIEGAVAPVLADANKLHEIFVNLCTNSAQAMSDGGGISISIENYSGTFNNQCPHGDYVRLTVSDSGVGIDAEVLPHIFEPFFTTKEQNVGTGMGLAVVYGIVKEMECEIFVSSTKGEGTTFTLLLPQYNGEVIEEDATVKIQRANQRKHIVFVDDEDDMVYLYKAVLESMGYSVTAFNDSTKAYQYMIEDHCDFDLLITDQTMPEMTGVTLAKHLHENRPDIPVLICTGYSSVKGFETLQEQKSSIEILSKPVPVNLLSKRVHSLLFPRSMEV